MKSLLLALLSFALISSLCAGDYELPAPQKTGGMPLMEALAKRSSARVFAPRPLTDQQLSNLLWAGFGVNRTDGRRTAPSANNLQEIELYVLLEKGAYVYDAAAHLLRLVAAEDLRAAGGRPNAPLTIVFVADFSKRTKGTPESKKNIACIDSGFISENIYLCCASEGLATCYRGGFDKAVLPTKLKLRPDQELIAVQSVGYSAAKP